MACSRWRRRTRSRPRGPARRAAAGWRRSRAGSIMTASAVAYGATTSSSPRPRFSPRPGHAERLVLIGAVPIDEVVGRLRDAPGHAARGGVVHLPAHGQPARLVEQRVRVAPHHQQRHQVLEQRRAPREQHRRAAHAGDRSSEVEPVHLRHVALGDREEAGQPGFGGEQVVVRRVEPAGAARRRPGGSRSRTAGACGSNRKRKFIASKSAVARAPPARGASVRAARRDSVRSAPARLPLSTVET